MGVHGLIIHLSQSRRVYLTEEHTCEKGLGLGILLQMEAGNAVLIHFGEILRINKEILIV